MRTRDFYWIIVPAVFVAAYTYTGIFAWDHLFYVLVRVQGHVLIAMPPHWPTYYNTLNGPVSSIFLSNFIYDGVSNTWIFGIYLVIFILTNVEVSNRSAKGVFLVAGSLLSAFIAGGFLRFFLTPGQFGYGESAVLAGFSGIVVYFLVENLLVEGTRKRIVNEPIEGAGYVALAIIGMGFLGVFFLVSSTVVIVHGSAMASGIVLAGMFSFAMRKRDRTRNRKTAILIPEKVRA